MAVELDVTHDNGRLSPGRYATVQWPVRGSRPALPVPRTSVVTTTERTFAVRGNHGQAEWVDVKAGASAGDRISASDRMEVTGQLRVRDKIVRRATDQMGEGSALPAPQK